MDTVFTAIERAALPKQVVYSDFGAALAMIAMFKACRAKPRSKGQLLQESATLVVACPIEGTATDTAEAA